VSSTPGATTETGAYAKNTTVIEQPVDFTHLAPKYSTFVTDFIERSKGGPFFLYMPFSHVHTTAGNQPQRQYASCRFQNTSLRGAFGDALSEVDWQIGEVVAKLEETEVINNTLILFTGDNGPWLIQVCILLMMPRLSCMGMRGSRTQTPAPMYCQA
jgi:arylsulfatase A